MQNNSNYDIIIFLWLRHSITAQPAWC